MRDAGTRCADGRVLVHFVIHIEQELHRAIANAVGSELQPGVRDLLTKYHLRNFSIFLHQIGDNWYEFGYYEYTGNDFDGDMKNLSAEPRNQAWLEVCDPLQLPLEGETGWAIMEQVYFNA